jgi:hypothetical protein
MLAVMWVVTGETHMRQQKTISRKAAYILIASALLLSGTSCGASMSAEAFLREVNRDRDAAYEKYKGKDIILTGRAATLREQENGDVVLGLVGGDALEENIICRFDQGQPQARDELLRIKAGERVGVKCRLRQFQVTKSAVFMEKCQLQR